MDIIVTTAKGGVFTLHNATAAGMDHIAHDGGIYAIEETDTLKIA